MFSFIHRKPVIKASTFSLLAQKSVEKFCYRLCARERQIEKGIENRTFWNGLKMIPCRQKVQKKQNLFSIWKTVSVFSVTVKNADVYTHEMSESESEKLTKFFRFKPRETK